MANKKRSPMEDLFILAARTPWWVGVCLAIASFFLLRWLGAPKPLQGNVTQIGAQLPAAMLRSVAYALSYVLPLVFLLAAAVSAFRQRTRGGLVAKAASAPAADALNGMSWREFEQLVGEAFRRQGYRVVETGDTGGGADGGVDLILRKGNEKFLVQCKQWRALTVGVDVVRSLYGVMAAEGATGGFVVTSGTFSSDAQKFADGRNVRLIDGKVLHGLIQQVQQAKSSPVTAAPPTARPTAPRTAAPSAPVAPTCPKCNSAMILRTAKAGTDAGKQFWGCSAFPKCRGTRPAT